MFGDIKQILLAVLTLFLLIGCNEKSEKQYSQELQSWIQKEAKYDSLVIEQLKTGKRDDEIILGFKFHDSQRGIDRKLKNLLKERKLRILMGTYQYELSLNPYITAGKGNASLTFELIDDTLYKVVLLIIGTDLSESEEKSFDQTVFNVYKDKYVDNWIVFRNPTQELNPKHQLVQFKRIKNNQEIIITSIAPGMVSVEYIDKIAEKKKEGEPLYVEKYIPKIKSNKSLDDI